MLASLTFKRAPWGLCGRLKFRLRFKNVVGIGIGERSQPRSHNLRPRHE